MIKRNVLINTAKRQTFAYSRYVIANIVIKTTNIVLTYRQNSNCVTRTATWREVIGSYYVCPLLIRYPGSLPEERPVSFINKWLLWYRGDDNETHHLASRRDRVKRIIVKKRTLCII